MMMTMMFGDLTEDLTMEILLRLAAKDLMRLKAVCRSLYFSINSSEFIAKHFLVDSDPYMLVQLSEYPVGSIGTRILSNHEDDDKVLGPLAVIGTIPSVYCVTCCCDGILFVEFCDWSTALWNPATGDFKPFPNYEDVLSDLDDDEIPLSLTNYGYAVLIPNLMSTDPSTFSATGNHIEQRLRSTASRRKFGKS